MYVFFLCACLNTDNGILRVIHSFRPFHTIDFREQVPMMNDVIGRKLRRRARATARAGSKDYRLEPRRRKRPIELVEWVQ
jgi:hypothetical protein